VHHLRHVGHAGAPAVVEVGKGRRPLPLMGIPRRPLKRRGAWLHAPEPPYAFSSREIDTHLARRAVARCVGVARRCDSADRRPVAGPKKAEAGVVGIAAACEGELTAATKGRAE
jgi:hypothetical protein